MNTSSIVQKLWNYCNLLRDAGPAVSCGLVLAGEWLGFDHQYRLTRQHPLRGRIPATRGPCSARRVASIFDGGYVEAAPAHPCARGIRTSVFSTELPYLLFLLKEGK